MPFKKAWPGSLWTSQENLSCSLQGEEKQHRAGACLYEWLSHCFAIWCLNLYCIFVGIYVSSCKCFLYKHFKQSCLSKHVHFNLWVIWKKNVAFQVYLYYFRSIINSSPSWWNVFSLIHGTLWLQNFQCLVSVLWWLAIDFEDLEVFSCL